MKPLTITLLLPVVLILQSEIGIADAFPFTVSINEVSYCGVPGLQSFAAARTADGRWLCICGRRAGLHGQKSNAASSGLQANFDRINDRVWVIDLPHQRVASRALSDLVPQSVADSLTVVHPEYFQVNNTLYVVGGYGLPTGVTTMTTYNTLTLLDVAEIADAVVSGGAVGNHIRQAPPDNYLQVTGGELNCIDGTFYLVFGQRFDFNYDPNANGFYTYQVRPFQVNDAASGVTIAKCTAAGSARDQPQYRRRDLNLVAAIRPGGHPGLTVYGGVFRPFPDQGSWTQPIYIDPASGAPNVSLDGTWFQQRLCQYNCATLPVYSASSQSMTTLFFGGISEVVYATSGGFTRDVNLPFVDHIGCITRRADGTSTEFLVCAGGANSTPSPLRLPALLGTSSRFIPAALDARTFHDGVLDVETLRADTVVGHILGGIAATKANGGTSDASNRIFEIHVSPVPSTAIPVPSSVVLTPTSSSSRRPPP